MLPKVLLTTAYSVLARLFRLWQECSRYGGFASGPESLPPTAGVGVKRPGPRPDGTNNAFAKAEVEGQSISLIP